MMGVNAKCRTEFGKSWRALRVIVEAYQLEKSADGISTE